MPCPLCPYLEALDNLSQPVSHANSRARGHSVACSKGPIVDGLGGIAIGIVEGL